MRSMEFFLVNVVYSYRMKTIWQEHKPRIIDLDKNKKSSVFIPLIKKEDGYHVLFEIRSANIRQPGDVSFPGGKMEKGEKPIDTAIRETMEELRIRREQIEVFGQADTYVTGKNRIIYAFVGEIKEPIDPNEEVESVFTVPLHHLMEVHPEIYISTMVEKPADDFPYDRIQNGKEYHWMKGKKEVLFYTYKNYTIWGITAKILQAFLEVMKEDNK